MYLQPPPPKFVLPKTSQQDRYRQHACSPPALSFNQCPLNTSLYMRHAEKLQDREATVVYRDDLLGVSEDTNEITWLYIAMQKKYCIKGIGPPTSFFSWTLNHIANESIHLSHPHPITSLMKKSDISHATNRRTSLRDKSYMDDSCTSQPLSRNDKTSFQSLLRELRYLSDSARLFINHAVYCLAPFTQSPFRAQQDLLHHTARCFKQTAKHGVLYD